ncbi:uncharacterized protein LOC135468406 [Liolophura sinensis]|uniref:uncharacterized protein LOC135468406 n=1 Tax=Liolophura sinensis TaxID=3198878 RepID=UPI0031598CA0
MTGTLRLLIWSVLLGLAYGQCFGPGDIAASVIVPLVLAAVIVAAVFIALWKARMIVFCPGRKIIKSPEGNGATGNRVSNHGEAYSNPGFMDDQISADVAMEEGHGGIGEGLDNGKTPKDKKVQSPKKGGQKGSPVSQQTSASSKSKLGFDLPGKNLNRMVSTTSLDDTFLNTKPEVVSVCLQSQDFIGLGFNIQGSIRDGIRVSQVHNRGPAIESGKIHAGDRIQSVTISFESMVYEDALTILSYASPYPVKVTLQKNGRMVPDRRSANDLDTQLNHPIYRSQSLDTLNTVGKDSAFKKKRNFSEMKPDSYRNGHSKIHSVQLSSCKEGQPKQKWEDINLPVFQDGKYSEEADKLFSDADKLFNEAKRNAEKRDDVNIKVKTENVEVSPAEVSLNANTDKTDSSFFDVTAGSLSTLNDSSLPSDTLDDITVSLNNTPVKDVSQSINNGKSETAQAALDFDAMFSRIESTEKPPAYSTLQDKIDETLNTEDPSRQNNSKDGRTVNLFDVQLEMDAAETRVANVSDDIVDAKQSLATEAEVSLGSLQQNRLEVEEGIVPIVQSSRLNAALDFDKRSSVEEEDIVPQNHKKAFDIDTQIEFEDVEIDVNNDNEVRDLTEITKMLSEDMLRDSSSVEASMSGNIPSDTEAVVEENLEAVSVRRDSSTDKIYGASLRDSRSLFENEPTVVSEVVTQEFAAPKFSVMSPGKVTSSSGDEDSSAEEGEYKIESTVSDENIEVSHDLSAEDLNSFKAQMMADRDRAYRVEASSGDVVQELWRANTEEDTTDLSTRPMTRAMSYDVAMGGHEKTVQREDRPGSFKSEKKGHSDSGFLDWSGKRLVRSGSFSEIPSVDGKDGENRNWTFNNNIDDESVKHELKKYKNYEDLRDSDSESEEQSSGLIRTKIYPGFENLKNLSDNNSGASSHSSSPVTANGGDSNTHTSRFVTKSYHISTVETSKSEGDGNLSHGKYSFMVRSGSDGEESDSMA